MTDEVHFARLTSAAMLIILLIIPNCSEDKPTEPLDTIPPAAIADLATGNPANNSLILTWTAPGDDGGTGTASLYDIRYSDSSINADNWVSASRIYNEPRPRAAGEPETLLCTGLIADTSYFYAMKTADEESNWSALSNITSGRTLADDISPAAIADLTAIDPDFNSLTLIWTSTGDDGNTGTAAQYDLRYYDEPIDDSNWDSAIHIDMGFSPKPAGEIDSFTVAGLERGVMYYFALKSADEELNWSALSNIAGETTLSDDIPPAAITDLTATDPTYNSVTLYWTSTGDDGYFGAADKYDLRYYNLPIDDANWDSAEPVDIGQSPEPAGGSESFAVTGLFCGITYYFALKIIDENPNWSGLSNVVNATTLSGDCWSQIGFGTDIVNGSVAALAIYNGRLIAGGFFTHPGNRIAAWDGSTWMPLGSGMDGPVYALAVYENLLIAGGTFTAVEGIPAKGIAAWDGSSWSPLSSYFSPLGVKELLEYDGRLIAGGGTEYQLDDLVLYCWAWNGSNWFYIGQLQGDPALQGEIRYKVHALSVYNGLLIAGGDFTMAECNCAVAGIGAWNGSSWSQLGSWRHKRVYALTVYDNLLIAGGWFSEEFKHIAAWDGSAWTSLGTGTNNTIHAFLNHENLLIAGGSFSTAGGISANCIAAWDGSSWSPYTEGMLRYGVLALIVYNGRLIAAGTFRADAGGGRIIEYIAAWND